MSHACLQWAKGHEVSLCLPKPFNVLCLHPKMESEGGEAETPTSCKSTYEVRIAALEPPQSTGLSKISELFIELASHLHR